MKFSLVLESHMQHAFEFSHDTYTPNSSCKTQKQQDKKYRHPVEIEILILENTLWF